MKFKVYYTAFDNEYPKHHKSSVIVIANSEEEARKKS